MSALRETQEQLLDFLRGGATEVERLIADQPPLAVEARLSIYRNAYRVRLRKTLESDHQMLWRYLGDEHFADAVARYIDTHPSHFTSLRYFGDRLPRFLATSAPFDEHPEIAEIATFERRLMDSFDAAEAPRLSEQRLAELDPADWPQMRLRFHPSVQPFRAQWNSVEIWRALKAEERPPTATSQANSDWLLWRGRDQLTQYRSLSELESLALQQLLAGADFAALCEAMLDLCAADQVSVEAVRLLRDWLEQGVVSALVVG